MRRPHPREGGLTEPNGARSPSRRRTRLEGRRLLATQVFAAAAVAVLLVSESVWEGADLWTAAFFLVGIVLVGAASVGRIWCALYISGYKTGTLVTQGPYSMSRNPLYFFSLLGAIGVGLTTETLVLPGVLTIGFALFYPWVIRDEEGRLREVHGAAFDAYSRETPRFWPSFSHLREPDEYPVKPRRFRRSIVDALWFIWLVGLVELAESAHEVGWLPVWFRVY